MNELMASSKNVTCEIVVTRIMENGDRETDLYTGDNFIVVVGDDAEETHSADLMAGDLMEASALIAAAVQSVCSLGAKNSIPMPAVAQMIGAAISFGLNNLEDEKPGRASLTGIKGGKE